MMTNKVNINNPEAVAKAITLWVRHTRVRGLYAGCATYGGGIVILRFNSVLPPVWHYYAGNRARQLEVGFPLWGGEETALYTVAHELCHALYGLRNEVTCDQFAYQVVQAWRDRQFENPACLI